MDLVASDAAVGSRLAALATALSASTDGDVVAQAVLAGALSGFDVTAVVISEATADGGELIARGRVDLSGEIIVRSRSQSVTLLGSMAAAAFRSGQDHWDTVSHVGQAYPLSVGSIAPDGLAPDSLAAALPLRHHGVPIGVLTLALMSTIRPPADLIEGARGVVALWLAASRSSPTSHARTAVRPLITPRQRAVLDLASTGSTNLQIARRLGFAEGTIKADLTALYRLLGARDRADLLRIAGEAGLIHGPPDAAGDLDGASPRAAEPADLGVHLQRP